MRRMLIVTAAGAAMLPRVSQAYERPWCALTDIGGGVMHENCTIPTFEMCHRSREFIEFLKLVDSAYPADTAIHLILDNHSAHISRETRAWLAEQPAGRFEFTFTPKHGSWLNLVEGFFSKLARSVLRHIRVSSKQELKERLMAAVDYFNCDPVVHTWTYKLDKAA